MESVNDPRVEEFDGIPLRLARGHRLTKRQREENAGREAVANFHARQRKQPKIRRVANLANKIRRHEKIVERRLEKLGPEPTP